MATTGRRTGVKIVCDLNPVGGRRAATLKGHWSGAFAGTLRLLRPPKAGSTSVPR